MVKPGVTPSLFEAEKVEEADGRLGVRDSEHGVEEAHGAYLAAGGSSFTVGVTPSSSIAFAAALPMAPSGSPARAWAQ